MARVDPEMLELGVGSSRIPVRPQPQSSSSAARVRVLVLALLASPAALALCATPTTAIPNLAVPTSWSNRLGLTLTPVTTGVWAAERPFVWNKIDVGGRSVIARMAAGAGESVGKLVVHSPIEWTPSLGESLASLGEVGALIAPNYEHLKYIAQWATRYPEAQVWACPGLSSRMPEVAWTHEFSSEPFNAPAGLEALWLDVEVNPFTGKPFFNEVIFYRAASKTLFVTDCWWNYPVGDRPNFDGITGTGSVHACPRTPVSSSTLPSVPVPRGTTMWKFGMDRVYLPFYRRLMVGYSGERRRRYKEMVERLFAWDVEVLVPCHGDVICGRELCRSVLKDHFEG